MDDIALRVENLSKAYPLYQKNGTKAIFSLGLWGNTFRNKKDYFWALRDISFEVKKGEVLGIIGPNGAGKSTLLKILARITEPTRGRIEIQGRVQALLEVGTGFQPELTGRENIFLNGAMLGMRQQEIRQKFEEIVDFSGISAFIDTPVKYYSSGMYVRLAFSVAVHLDADILILDEVLAVGDSDFQQKCIGKIESIKKNEKVILLVSHHLPFVSRLVDTLLIMKEGKLFQSGKPDWVISQYLNNLNKDDKLNAQISLKSHPNKWSSSETGFQELRLGDSESPTAFFYPLEKFEFSVRVKVHHHIRFIQFGFIICDKQGNSVIGINNQHLCQKLPNQKDEPLDIHIAIPQLLIYREGLYSLSIYLGDAETDKNFDIIELAAYFKVLKKKAFGNGRMLDERHNLFVQPGVEMTILQP
ncbi:MAG: hypothetical protein OHK0053_23830 [Microscillaceae bacterium]